MARYVPDLSTLFTCHMPSGNMGIVEAKDLSYAEHKVRRDMKQRGMSMEGVTVTPATLDDIKHFKSMGGTIW